MKHQFKTIQNVHFNGPDHTLHDMQTLALEKALTLGQRILEKTDFGPTSLKQNIQGETERGDFISFWYSMHNIVHGLEYFNHT